MCLSAILCPRRAGSRLKLYTIPIVSLLLILISAGRTAAQSGTDSSGTGGIHVIQGRLLFPSGQRVDVRLKVRLESTGSGDLSVFSDTNGSFTFSSLSTGSYAVVIDGGDQFESVRESIYIEQDLRTGGVGALRTVSRPYTVQIFLRPKASAHGDAATPGVLNAALAGVPKPALEHYNKARELARAGDAPKAIEQLQLAITAHPKFALALGELGALYSKNGQPEKAIEAFRQSLQFAPEDYATLVSYGIVLFEHGDFEAAEQQLRRCLKSKPAASMPHLYLGMIHVKLRQLDEAEKEFRQATAKSDDLATAHYYLGGLYWKKGDLRRAADELETYLKLNPKAADAERVRGTVRELRAKS